MSIKRFWIGVGLFLVTPGADIDLLFLLIVCGLAGVVF